MYYTSEEENYLKYGIVILGAYDGYSKNGWQGNYKGQAKGTRAGGRWDNVNG